MPRLGQVPVSAERLDLKFCPRCSQTKPLSEFHKSTQGPDARLTGSKGGKGHNPALAQSSYCKPCHLDYSREYHKRPGVQEQRAKWRLRRNMAKYGITPETYEEMLLAQGRKCAICGTDEPGGQENAQGIARFAVDHCHSTGKVRGLLCTRCNTGIGMFNEDISAMAAAIAYIEDFKEK